VISAFFEIVSLLSWVRRLTLRQLDLNLSVRRQLSHIPGIISFLEIFKYLTSCRFIDRSIPYISSNEKRSFVKKLLHND